MFVNVKRVQARLLPTYVGTYGQRAAVLIHGQWREVYEVWDASKGDDPKELYGPEYGGDIDKLLNQSEYAVVVRHVVAETDGGNGDGLALFVNPAELVDVQVPEEES